MSEKKKRIFLSTADKLKILDRLKNGETRHSIIKELGIGMRTIERLISNEKAIRHEAETSTDLLRKRKRQSKNDTVDDALGKWFTAVRNQKQIVTGPMLKQKSEDFAKELGLGDKFVASNGWLSRWKKRNEIKFKRAHGEKSSADVSVLVFV